MKSTPSILLTQVNEFRQPENLHPRPNVVPLGFERVEVVTGGRCWVTVAGAWTELRPGDIVWHYHGDETIGRSDFSDPYRCLNAIFKVDQSSSVQIDRVTHWGDLERISSFMREVFELWLGQILPKEVLSSYVYSTLLFHASKGTLKAAESQKPRQVQRAIVLMEKDFACPLTMVDLAQEADCSSAYLHELFKKHCHLSPHAMLLSIRIREACRRLSTSSDPIKQIAAEVGFPQASAFSYSFRQHMGRTPAAYRRKVLNPF